MFLFFFFFQAEDGIRDRDVTGVQTCALPIFGQSLQDAEGRADEFLKNAEASIVFSLGRDVHDSRALELINKTNQFNLNGKRFSESDWIGYLNEPGAFLLTANYEDKYGPLGKVSVLIGRDNGSLLTVA